MGKGGRARFAELSSPRDKTIILGMRTDPEPENPIRLARSVHSDGAIVNADSDRPEIARFLEVERRVLRMRLEEGEAPAGCLADVRG